MRVSGRRAKHSKDPHRTNTREAHAPPAGTGSATAEPSSISRFVARLTKPCNSFVMTWRSLGHSMPQRVV